MPKFRVHLYPIYRTMVEVEAESAEAAYRAARNEAADRIPKEIGPLVFADEISGGLCDEIDQNGETIAGGQSFDD